MADAIDIITRLLDGEIITQESEWYRMKEARLHLRPYSQPRPHLAIASAVTPYGGKLAGRYDLGILCVMAGSPNGYDALDYNWELANREAAAQGRTMDRANYRVMAPFRATYCRASRSATCGARSRWTGCVPTMRGSAPSARRPLLVRSPATSPRKRRNRTGAPPNDQDDVARRNQPRDRKSTRLNSSH